jgi:hypothetical protein
MGSSPCLVLSSASFSKEKKDSHKETSEGFPVPQSLSWTRKKKKTGALDPEWEASGDPE